MLAPMTVACMYLLLETISQNSNNTPLLRNELSSFSGNRPRRQPDQVNGIQGHIYHRALYKRRGCSLFVVPIEVDLEL